MITIQVTGNRGAGKTVIAKAIIGALAMMGVRAAYDRETARRDDSDVIKIDPLFDPAVFMLRDKSTASGEALNFLRDDIHARNVAAGWWSDLATGQRIERNDGEMIALMHSELSEGLEGVRKSKMDDHLPHRPMVEVEMADTIIRILDYCGGRGLDIGGALVEKLAYNAQRADHKPENRKLADGKKI